MNTTPREAEKLAFLERLEKARALKSTSVHLPGPWCQGRDAAIAAIEADGNTSRARTIAIPEAIDCRACFLKGRDVVITFIEGTLRAGSTGRMPRGEYDDFR